MYKLLLLFFGLFLATPAAAAPVVVALASAAATAAGAGATAAALVQLAVGVAFSLASAQMQRNRARQPELTRDFARPNSLPVYRHNYGLCRTNGSPWPWYIKGGILYGVLLFNSRPSDGGNFKLTIDKRKCTLTGNLFDLDGGGAQGTEWEFADGHLRVWLGRGDQTRPPKMFTDEAPEKFKVTDGWRGLTVLFIRADCGDNDSRAERWPSVPPEFQVEADWSRVWDPRKSGQSASDATTWTYSANRSLCVLDALRTNPVRQYQLRSLILDLFRESADVDDERVPLKGGGTEPRYEAHGVLAWADTELEQQIAPLIAAGAGGTTRIGGRLGMIPGAWRAPEITLTDILDEGGLQYEVLKPGRDLATAVRGKYMSADRDWTLQDAGIYAVPGVTGVAGGSDGVQDVTLDMVTSISQAQRILKWRAQRQRAQRAVTATFPPDAFEAIGGSNVQLTLPAPYTALNRSYEVQSTQPAMDLVGESGVAMRCPMELVESAESDWAWNPDVDQQEVEQVPVTIESRERLPPPDVIHTDTGGPATSTPRIRFYFDPVDSDRVDAFDWEYRESSGGAWQAGGSINADVRANQGIAEGKVYGFVRDVEAGTYYDIRVRSMDGETSGSVWSYAKNVMALGPITSLPPPTPVASDTTASGDAYITFRLPSDDGVVGLEVWTSTSNSSSGASKYFTLGGASSMTLGITVPRNGAYYWGKTRGAYGYVSAFSASIRAF